MKTVTGALSDVASFGPYFAITTNPAEEADPTWLPFPGGLRGLTESTARSLGTTEDRVAASTVQLGLAARLWSPVVACALTYGVVPSLAGLHHRPGAAVPFWLPEVRGLPSAEPGDVYRAVAEQLEPLHKAIRDEVKVAEGLLWGNAASALAGALRVLASARPDLATRAHDLATDLLVMGELRHTGSLTGPLTFRRRSCCLYYRAPGGGLCGDCCFIRAGSS